MSTTAFAKPAVYARARGFGESTVRKWASKGMPHIGGGRTLRILVAEADRWITERAKAEERARALAKLPIIVAEVQQ